MKKLISALLIGAMLSTSVPAFAEPPAPAPTTDVGEAVSPMRKGQVAPFTGVLLSPTTSARITVDLRSIPDQIKIEVDKATADGTARCSAAVSAQQIKAEADAKVAQAKLDASLSVNKTLTDRLKAEEKNHSNTALWAGGGVIVGVVGTVLVVVLTKK